VTAPGRPLPARASGFYPLATVHVIDVGRPEPDRYLAKQFCVNPRIILRGISNRAVPLRLLLQMLAVSGYRAQLAPSAPETQLNVINCFGGRAGSRGSAMNAKIRRDIDDPRTTFAPNLKPAGREGCTSHIARRCLNQDNPRR